ncbi:MAG TPA: hypothetical protein VLX31_03190 [Streptosporangiaceae bacterium]|nr:hypothetical protein [Streptosporangiaceae bacterium]
MRVYLPTTLAELGSALVAGQVGPAPVTGFAVTGALREWYSAGDLEELEYVAMTQAARASLRMLHADTKAPRRRVVLAAELPEQVVSVRNGIDRPGQVAVTLPVLFSDVVSGHVDDEEAMSDVEAAAAALPAADAGDEDAQFVVDGAEGHELLWYATQELIYLIGPV